VLRVQNALKNIFSSFENIWESGIRAPKNHEFTPALRVEGKTLDRLSFCLQKATDSKGCHSTINVLKSDQNHISNHQNHNI